MSVHLQLLRCLRQSCILPLSLLTIPIVGADTHPTQPALMLALARPSSTRLPLRSIRTTLGTQMPTFEKSALPDFSLANPLGSGSKFISTAACLVIGDEVLNGKHRM
ncbi:related to 3^-phosphoadenosine 5^-phosphosulfate sulfotransferase (PAPS reductase)/FAD synthetase and related enzymes [Ustilago sp. UG-2017a]|nr:related to 3^-phosphoadenosine 5^-phosphosulfate sulfotransferase (PAPS reductase)/FAD synthetase and related enzymes [Ustilago sp. UG-2017a]